MKSRVDMKCSLLFSLPMPKYFPSKLTDMIVKSIQYEIHIMELYMSYNMKFNLLYSLLKLSIVFRKMLPIASKKERLIYIYINSKT